MSLIKLVQNLCSNYRIGICAGIIIQEDLNQYVDATLAGKPCIIRNRRCKYFEGIVVSAVRNLRGTDPLKQSYERAVFQYESKALNRVPVSENNSNKLKKVPRHCRQCEKPVFGMKPNEKYCPACKERRINKSKRQSYRARLEKVRQLSLTM